MSESLSEKRAADDARGIGVNLLTLLAQASLPAFHVQLSRRLGAEGYGVYLWCDYLVDLFSLVTLFGMDQAVQRQLAMLGREGDRALMARVVGTALRTVVLSGLAVASLLWLLAPWVAARQHDPSLLTPLRVLALKPLFYHVTSIFIVSTQALGRMQYDFWTRGLAQPLTLLAATTLVLGLGGGVPSAAVAVTASIALTTVLSARLFARDLPLRATLRAAWSGDLDRDTLRTALPLVLAAMVWAVQGRIEPLLLAHWRGKSDVAALGAALLYVGSISQVRGIFAPVVLRHIPPALRDGRRDELMNILSLQVRWACMLAAPLAILFGGFGAPLLSVYGPLFTLGAGAMAVLSFAHLVNACSLAAYVIPMSGLGRYNTLVAVMACGLQLGLLPLLIPRFGLTGAAIGAAAGLVLSQVVQALVAWRIARVHGFSWGLVKVLLAALLGLCVGRGIFTSLPWSVAPRFFVGVSAAALSYVTAVLALGLLPEERALLVKLRARLGRIF